MFGLRALLFSLLVTVAVPSAAEAALHIRVHRTGQYLEVFENGKRVQSFRVSTGNPNKTVRTWSGNRVKGMETPPGSFHPTFIKASHVSRQSSNDRALPYWIFFNNSVAIHATDKVDRLGTKNSLGCVTLGEADAKWLYEQVSATVKREGRKAVRIEVLSDQEADGGCSPPAAQVLTDQAADSIQSTLRAASRTPARSKR